MHQLKKKVRSEEPFKVYGKAKKQLAASNSTYFSNLLVIKSAPPNN